MTRRSEAGFEKRGIRPQEVRVVGPEGCVVPTCLTRRKGRHAGIVALRDVLIIPWIEHQLGIGIANFCGLRQENGNGTKCLRTAC